MSDTLVLIFVIIAALIWIAWGIRRGLRDRQSANAKHILRRCILPRSHCRKCGYDLRATPDRCPECGTVPADSIFDHFTKSTRMAFMVGWSRARRMGKRELDDVDVLMGLVIWPENAAVRLLRRLNVDALKSLREKCQTDSRRNVAVSLKLLPVSESVNQLLHRAAMIADEIGYPGISTDVLLLAILESQFKSSHLLNACGLWPTVARKEIAATPDHLDR